MITVVVTGGRDYENKDYVFQVLDGVHLTPGIAILAHGACPYGGADELAEWWAKDREINYQGFPARWSEYGRAAGPRRNKAMLKTVNPDLVIAFPGGRGTEDCVKKALSMGIEVMDLRENPEALQN